MELTKAETIQMVALITSAYPNHDRFNSEEMIKAMVNVWANTFKDDDARLSFLLGNYITLTGKADRIDPVFRTLQVGDIVVPFEDLVEVSGEGIMDIDVYLGIGEE